MLDARSNAQCWRAQSQCLSPIRARTTDERALFPALFRRGCGIARPRARSLPRRIASHPARALAEGDQTMPRLLQRLAFASPALLPLALAASASAQIMPGPAPLYPADPAKPLYYKDGNGPAFSYFERWLPSNLDCSALSRGTDFISRYTNGLKCIPLGRAGDSFLTLNGTERLRSEIFSHTGLHAAAGTSAAGIRLKNTSANQSERYMTHSAVGADLHLTDHFRAYGQIDNGTQSGRNIVAPGPVAANRNTLSLLDLFGEGRLKLDETALAVPSLAGTIIGLRVGRENTGFGSDGFWFAPNGGTNLAGASFDGVRLYADQGARRLDLFAYHWVNEVNVDPRGGREPFL